MEAQEKKLIIGLDMDGVIVDNVKNKIAVAKKFGVNLLKKHTQSDVLENYVSQEVLAAIREYSYHNLETALTAELIPGAESALAAIKNSGAPYFLISRRAKPEVAKELLKKRGLWPNYFNEANAFFVEKPEDKNEKAVELGIHIYMDDQPSVLSKLTDVRDRILFDRFGNFGELPFVHKKVSTWRQFLNHLA